MKRVLTIVAAVALLAAAPAPSTSDVATVAQEDQASGLIGTQILLQAGLDRQTQMQNGLAALVAQTILERPTASVTLQDAVRALGGEITYTVEAHRVRFYVEGSAQQYAQIESALRAAFGHPDFSAATVAKARTQLDDRIAGDDRSALRVGINMLSRAFYPNSQAGAPRYGISETVAGFAPSDVAAFYTAHYRRGDAVVSSVGAISQAPSAASILADLPAGTSSPVPPRAGKPAVSAKISHQIIARRDVPVPWLIAEYRAPNIDSRDFGAMMILSEFLQRTLGEVSDVPSLASAGPAQRGVGVLYDFDSAPSNVIVYIDGGLGDPVRTFSTGLSVVGVIGHAKLSGDLTELKNFAAGRVLLDSQSLESRALLAAVFAEHHRSGDPLQTVVNAINATTAADLQRVAQRYLSGPTIALVLPRQQ